MKAVRAVVSEGMRIVLLTSVLLLIMLFAVAELGTTGFIYVKF
jgi:hypothetical protein